MRKLIFIIFVTASMLLISQGSEFDEGIRYLKLGNSYRQEGNYNKADEFLSKGWDRVSKSNTWNGKYWQAAGYEYYGYYSRDLGENDDALTYFNKSLSLYKDILSMDDGSQELVAEIIKSLGGIADQVETLESKGRTFSFGNSSTINLDNQKLDEVPYNIPKTVTNLSLSDNKFKKMPCILADYISLRYLNMANNKIKDICRMSKGMNNLRYLNLRENKIEEIPMEISRLQNLETLDLSGNKIEEIPPTLCEMKNLRILNLKNNKIPFEQIVNIIKCLPNTNVLFDEYELKKESKGLPAYYYDFE